MLDASSEEKERGRRDVAVNDVVSRNGKAFINCTPPHTHKITKKIFAERIFVLPSKI